MGAGFGRLSEYGRSEFTQMVCFSPIFFMIGCLRLVVFFSLCAMVFLLVRANEANMFEKTDSDVLEKIDHKISNESGDMVGVEEHVTDDGFGSGWESEEMDKTVGTAGFMTKGKKE